MTIFVGSTNPVKVNAVTEAAAETWPEVQVTGYEVASGVNAQPRSDEETRQGAENRARAALQQGLTTLSADQPQPNEVLGVGLEGGVLWYEVNGQRELWSTVWGAVVDTQGNVFVSNGARVKVPEPIATKIAEGAEMGPAVQEITGIQNIKHKHGMVGIITRSFVDRTEEYANIAKLALGLWYGRDWYEHLNDPE